MQLVNICNQIHFTLYKMRIGLGDEAWDKVSDKVRLTVRVKAGDEGVISNKVMNQGVNQVKLNVKL